MSQYKLFPKETMARVRDAFYWIDEDPKSGKRLFFENSGGSFRLKKAVEVKSLYEELPDCPERTHERALELIAMQKKAEEDIKTQIVDVSSALTEKLIEREITVEDHRRLIDSFISDMGELNDAE